MKIAIKGSFTFFGIVLLILLLMNMSLKNVRSNETNILANNSSYQSLTVLDNSTYSIDNIDQLVSELIQDIIMTKETDSSIKVQVLSVDAENGLVDINIIQTVNHVNGQITFLEERRTVILE